MALLHNSESLNHRAGLRAFARSLARSLSSAQCLCAPLPDCTEAPTELSGSGPTKCLCRLFFGTPAGDTECPCDGTELRWTQSHSSAIRGVAPIQTQIPTEIQSPSCCERQTYTQGRTPTLHLAPEKKGGSVYLPLHAPGTQVDSVCVCLKERNGRDYSHITHLV